MTVLFLNPNPKSLNYPSLLKTNADLNIRTVTYKIKKTTIENDVIFRRIKLRYIYNILYHLNLGGLYSHFGV